MYNMYKANYLHPIKGSYVVQGSRFNVCKTIAIQGKVIHSNTVLKVCLVDPTNRVVAKIPKR